MTTDRFVVDPSRNGARAAVTGHGERIRAPPLHRSVVLPNHHRLTWCSQGSPVLGPFVLHHRSTFDAAACIAARIVISGSVEPLLIRCR